jgi:hypothetical protein
MISLFLGAGFSKWSANLPLSKELFKFDITLFGNKEQKKFARIRSLKTEWDKNNPNGSAEEFISIILKNRKEDREILLWYITRVLSDPYIFYDRYLGRINRHVLMIDENRKNSCAGVEIVRNFVNHFMMEKLGIITTNYDLLLEYALGTKLFNYGLFGESLIGRGPYPVSQWKNPVTLKGKIPLLKLHGSLSWGIDGKHYTDGRRGITGNALIIAPTPEKTPPLLLKSIWDLSKEILKETNLLIVFGFAFNPYDEAILTHLKTSSDEIKKVAIIDINHLESNAMKIWPNADILSFPPPPTDKTSLSMWFQTFFKKVGVNYFVPISNSSTK